MASSTLSTEEFSPPRLFISYAREDGRRFVEGFETRLQAEGLNSWRDLKDVEGGEDIMPQVLRAIDEAEHLVLILTRRALSSDWVKAEWTHARAVGRKVSPVLADPTLRRSDLPHWIRRADVYDPEEPERWARLIAVLRGPGKTRRVPYHSGHLPDSFVPRPGPYDRLKQSILQADGGVVGLSTALIGAGGYGKTTLANALCRDEDIRFEFSDGVLRVEIGKDRTDVLSLISDLIETLDPGGQRPGFSDVNVAAEQLAHRLEKARLLLVLDDVWRESQVQPFLRGGPNCVRLVTTRSPRVLDAATRIDVDELTADEALVLLCWRLPDPSPAALKHLRPLARRLEGWAQMIEIANGWLRRRISAGRDLQTALEEFTRRLDRRGLTAFDPRDADARNRAIGLCVDASLEDLTDAERARFAELTILPEDTDTPIAISAALWAQTGGLDDIEAEDLLDRLADLSLLQRLDLGRGTVRLHDNMKWLLGERLGPAGTQAAHAAMAEALLTRAGGAWSTAPIEDSYTWRHAPAHLRAAGHPAAADGLLLDYGWIAGRIATLGATSLVEAGLPEPASEDARLVARALLLSVPALQRHPEQLSLQLVGRLSDIAVGRIPSLLSQTACASTHPATPRWSFLSAPTAERLRLTGHERFIGAITCSPDSTRVATASDDNTARVWDARTGIEIATMDGHEDKVNDVAFSPDGSRIATVSDDTTVRVWDAATGEIFFILRGHKDKVQYAAFSSDGSRIATASTDATARVWDAASGEEIATLLGHGEIKKVTFFPNSTMLATLSELDRAVFIWDIASATKTQTLQMPTELIQAYDLSPDGKRIATACTDGSARVWDVFSGRQTQILLGHKGWLSAVAFSPDGRYIATNSFDDRTTILWGANDGVRNHTLHGPEGSGPICFSPDGKTIATVSEDGSVRLWEVETGAECAIFRAGVGGSTVFAFAPDGTKLATASLHPEASIWDTTSSYSELGETHLHNGGGWTACAFSSDGALVGTTGRDRTARLWNAATGTKIAAMRGHRDHITAIAFSPDNDRIATASYDNTARVWDARAGIEIATMDGHEDKVNDVAFSPDGSRIATVSDDTTARVWDAETGEKILTLRGHKDRVWNVTFSLDGNQVATASPLDGTLRIWNAATGAEIATLRGGEEAELWAAAFPHADASIETTLLHSDELLVSDIQVPTRKDVILLDSSYRASAIRDKTLAVVDEIGRFVIFDFKWPD